MASSAKENPTKTSVSKNCPRKSTETLRTNFKAQDASTETLPRCTEPLSVHFQEPCSHRATAGHTIPVRDPSKLYFGANLVLDDYGPCWMLNDMLLNAFGEKM